MQINRLDKRIIRHTLVNGGAVLDFDVPPKEADVAHLAEPSAIEQIALGSFHQDDLDDLRGGFPIFSPKSDWSGVRS